MHDEGKSQSPRHRSSPPVEQCEQGARVGILCRTREYSTKGQSHFSTDEKRTLELILFCGDLLWLATSDSSQAQ